jgi:hypothetical protein
LQDPVKVKLERDAKSVSDDGRGADGDTDDRRARDGPEVVVEEDADGLGNTDATANGTESESVEDAGFGGKRKRSPSSASTHRNGENMGEEADTSRVERNKRLHAEKDESGRDD